MIYMCLMRYIDDSEAVARVRPRHKDYAFRLLDEGKLICGGTFPPACDGGLFLYLADSLDDAKRLVSEDPYALAGVIRDCDIREYETRGVNPALLHVTAKPV